MHRQWQTVEDEYSRLATLINQGSDRELSHSLDSMTPEQLITVITHIARDGQTILHLASVREKLDSLRIMLKNRVDVSMRDGNGSSPLYACLTHNALSSARLLINCGADVNELLSRQTGESLLHKMIKADRVFAVDLLLEAGINVESATRDGERPLHYAARYNRLNMAKFLLVGGAEINAVNCRKETPLHVSIASRSMDVAKLLVKGNANLTNKDRQGMTPLHCAVAASATELVRLMLTHNSTQVNSKEALLGRTPLLMACSTGTHRMATLLLSHGADANLTTNYRKSVLHVAACSGNANVLGAVLKHTTNLNALAVNNMTPLHYAVTEGNGDIVKILLQAGVNTNLRDIDGNTALHTASSTGNNDITSLLLHHDVHINATNMQQQTALHVACMMGHEETSWILIDCGCDPEILDIHKATAQYYLDDFRRKQKEIMTLQNPDQPSTRKVSKVRFSDTAHEQPQSILKLLETDEENDLLVAQKEETQQAATSVVDDAVMHKTSGNNDIPEQSDEITRDLSDLLLSDLASINGHEITDGENTKDGVISENDGKGQENQSANDDVENGDVPDTQRDAATSEGGEDGGSGHRKRHSRTRNRKSSKGKSSKSSHGSKHSNSRTLHKSSNEEEVKRVSVGSGRQDDIKCQRKRKVGMIIVNGGR